MDLRERRIVLYVSFLCEDGMEGKDLHELYDHAASFVDEHENDWTDLVAVDADTGEETSVGFICAWPTEEDNLRVIQSLYVDVNNRGRSYGTKLLEDELHKYPESTWCYVLPASNSHGRSFMTHKFMENGYSSYKVSAKQKLDHLVVCGWRPDPERLAIRRKEDE